MRKRNGDPTETNSDSDEQKATPISRRRWLQVAGAGLVGSTAMAATSTAQESLDRLEIVARNGATVDYTFTSDDTIELVAGKSFTASNPNEDAVTEDGGTWTADGYTADGYGDAYDLSGPVRSFEPSEGEYDLYLNGSKISRDDLVQPKATRKHWYSFEATGSESADYYIEVKDGGNMIASTVDDAIIESEFHWINDDGTKAAGRIDPGETHAYAFDTLVADVTIDGDAHATVDGNDSDLSLYPTDSASGNHWKGYFPWHIAGEERKHWYSFEATGDQYADYYIEVKDGGEIIPSTVNDAIIEYEFFWISEDGTKAAGRVDPGETHAYAFDTSILDVTVDGEAHAMVNGSDSDLGWYPRPGATGDGWKGGFPWQDGDSPTTTTGSTALGGGSGYDRILTSSDADYVVQSASGLENALASASSGEVVFVAGDAVIDTGGRSMDVPGGVTLASNRGENGAPGALLHTEQTPQIMLRPQANARVTGLRLRGMSPNETVTHQDGISFDTPTYAMRLEGGDVEVDNCEVWGWPDRAISVQNPGAHVHHNYIYDNNGQGLGYGVAAAAKCLIEYNYFHNNRHSVTCAYDAPGYTARYNHFSPVSVMHICDVHDPFQGDTTLDANIVENGDTRTWDANDARGVAGYSGGFDGGSLTVTANWFFDQACAYDDGFPKVSDSGNVYGDETTHDPADVIPNHPGLSDRPWL